MNFLPIGICIPILTFTFFPHLKQKFFQFSYDDWSRDADFDQQISTSFSLSLLLQLPPVVVYTKLWKHSLTFFLSPPYLHLHSFLFVSTRGKKLHPLFHFAFHRLEIHQQTRQEEVSVNLETVAIICNTLLAITTKISHKYIFEFSDKYVFELNQPRYRTNIYLKTKIGT